MFLCCCVRLHRHQLHLASYGFVSMSLIVTGFVFTVFAVFHRDTPIEPTTANSASGPTAAITEKKDEQNDQPWDWIGHSRLGKIWLAGPVLMVVGGVLCGKVMIDWGPAMARGRRGSLDSQLMDELVFANLLPIDGAVAKAARASLIMAHSEAEPSKLMRTARFSCTSAASVSSSTAAAIDHFLLASSAGTTAGGGGAVVGVPNHYNLSCPLLPPSWPPPMCALYGSSSSASSINSQKNGGCNFDRIIYGPLDHQQMLNDNEEADEQIENGTRNNDNGNDQIRQKSNNTNNCNANTLDKSTQSEEQWGDCAADSSSYGCERCATFWPILERKRNNDSEKTQERQEEEEERPKVIGKFVFAQLLEKRAEGGGGRKSPNYGTILTGHNGDDHPQQLLMDHNNVDCERMERRTMNDVKETSSQNKTNNSNNNSNRRTSRACCSQGETLIINERSFLI